MHAKLYLDKITVLGQDLQQMPGMDELRGPHIDSPRTGFEAAEPIFLVNVSAKQRAKEN